VLAKDTPAQLFSTTTYPNAPRGASELYLKEDIFISNLGNDLLRSEAERLWASRRRFHGCLQHAIEGSGVEDHPILVFRQHRRSDHHADLGVRDGPPCTLTHHSVPRWTHLTLISHPGAVTAVMAAAVCSLH
jgi:hypothetical protein